MSLHYPRRIKDLPTLDVDDEDEIYTPQKISESEKKNKQTSLSQQCCNADTSQRMYPKRISELPNMNSDSELDDSLKSDHLNCAILNDSFLLSPCKNDHNEGTALETPAGKLLKKNAQLNVEENISFDSHFNKLALNTKQEETQDQESRCKPQPTPNCTNQSFKQSICCPTLEIIEENEQLENSVSNTQKSNASQRRKVIDTPYRSTFNVKRTSTAIKATAQSNESHFATPQIRSFSIQKRPRDLCSTQSRKSHAAMANEFRSQKVLFQTPIALSRNPLACLADDSVTLSLCDETGNTPSTIEKTPQKEELRENTGKSKKSLERVFAATANREEKENKETIISPTKSSADTASMNSTRQTTTNSKETSNKTRINEAEFNVIQKLGCGGSSSVYLAKRCEDGKECALKVVDLRGDPVVVEGYMNETKLLAKLQGNACVVSLYDYQLLQKESRLLMVMEKGDSDLQKILQGYTTNLPLYILINYIYQMLQAVNYIHQNGVIHSDLKPANFLMVQGRLKLIDFGIASNIAIDSTSIIKFSQAGTFNYISPEALIDTSSGTSPIRHNQPKIKISTKSDVWSLGCILYLFLYKKTPFSHIKNIYAKITAVSNPKTIIEYPGIPSYYPIMLVHMVKNCLQHNPKQRPSCAELLQYPFHMIIPISNLAVATEASAAEKKTQL